MDGEETASNYMNSTQFLLIGGFFLALAMEKWNLHKRIALKIVLLVGVRPPLILFGMMIASFVMSMFISNTAAAMMNLPNAIALLKKMEEMMPPPEVKKFGTAIFLGLAYSAGLGGTATLVGSPPNLVLGKVFKIYFENAPDISFARWMGFGLPVSIVLFGILYLILYIRYCPKNVKLNDVSVLKVQYQKLGKIKFEEVVVIIDFLLLAILWLFRSDIDFGSFVIPGWTRIFPQKTFINDGVVAIVITLPLFAIPAREVSEEGEQKPEKKEEQKSSKSGEKSVEQAETAVEPKKRDNEEVVFKEAKKKKFRMIQTMDLFPKEKKLMRKTQSTDLAQIHDGHHKKPGKRSQSNWTGRILGWKLASTIPWDVILLLGGGFALASAFQKSGLSESIGNALSGLKEINVIGTVIIICFVVHVLTEFTSNTATAQVILPIVASLAIAINKNPLILMIPACFSASYAFIMPIGTPPNLIVFATKRLELKDMMTTGAMLSFSSIVVVVFFTFVLAGPVYGFSSWDFPSEWIATNGTSFR